MKRVDNSAMKKWSAWLAVLLTFGVLSACIPRATSDKMMPTALTRQPQHAASVAVRVDSDDVQLSTLPALEFKQAIENAIGGSGVFSKISEQGNDFQLTARITSLDVPAAFAWDRQVRLVVNWELKRTSSGQAAWKDVISTKFVTTTSDAWGGMERTKLSTEGAARENIREALEQLRQLKLN